MWFLAVEVLVDEQEKIFDHGKDITEEEDRETYLCINNMLAYLFSWFICHMEEHIKNVNESNIGKVWNLPIILYVTKLYEWRYECFFVA